jgi:hypothetical protein
VGAFTSIAAVGLSLESLLTRRLDAAFTADSTLFRRRSKARLVRTEQFSRAANTVGAIDEGTVSIFCYRADIDRTMRPPWSAVSATTGRTHVPIDLHFLFTAWDSDAEAELRLIGFTLLTLESVPSLSGPLLHPAGAWEPGESVQLINEDLLTEDVLRTFETLPADFRLSVSYVARVVRLSVPIEPDHGDVLTAVSGSTPTPVRA